MASVLCIAYRTPFAPKRYTSCDDLTSTLDDIGRRRPLHRRVDVPKTAMRAQLEIAMRRNVEDGAAYRGLADLRVVAHSRPGRCPFYAVGHGHTRTSGHTPWATITSPRISFDHSPGGVLHPVAERLATGMIRGQQRQPRSPPSGTESPDSVTPHRHGGKDGMETGPTVSRRRFARGIGAGLLGAATAPLIGAATADAQGTLTAREIEEHLPSSVVTGVHYKEDAIGNLAIGASLPHVTGAANTAMGVGALASAAEGRWNSAFGYGALAENTSQYNTALGTFALLDNTTGQENTAIGVESMLRNTTGGYNIAIGNNTLEHNTSGSFNVAVGSHAMFENVEGQYNTAVGYYALEANTAGQYNTALGRGALRRNTTGEKNVGVGNTALGANSTGSQNVAVGHSALSGNTSGKYSAVVGVGAMASNVSGGYSAALGTNALHANASGNFNIGIGFNAGNTDGTTETSPEINNAVLIGWNAQATTSNVMVLGGAVPESRVSVVIGAVGSAANLGQGRGVVALANAVKPPSSNYPGAGGGQLYAQEGALYWRGGAGTVTKLANA